MPAERTYPGVFITFEGGDGTGKSTHIRYLTQLLEDQGFEVLGLREPGGTAVGEALRAVVLDPAHTAMSDRAELLIYEAARAQIVDEVIAPALQRGAVVLCDRFFDSTVAYQGFGRGLDRAFVDAANAFATDGLVPDRTVLLCATDAGARVGRRAQADRLEQAGADFHQRVSEGFEALCAAYPQRVVKVESRSSKAATFRAVLRAVADVVPGLPELLAGDGSAIDDARHAVDARQYGCKEVQRG